MSAYDWFVTAIGLILVPLVLRRLPAIWRNEHGWDPDYPPPGWLYDRALWRALVRTNPVSVGLLVLCVPVYVLSEAGTTSLVGVVVLYALGLAGAACAGLAVSVAVANRPKWLVAPHLRHQPGLIAEWRGAPCAETPPPKNAPRWQTRSRRRARGAPADTVAQPAELSDGAQTAVPDGPPARDTPAEGVERLPPKRWGA